MTTHPVPRTGPVVVGRPATPARTVIHLVPHTHWDREWYLPWQRFRMRLVDLVDGLLEEMAADDRVRFTLDGQTATVDDYLEIRPEREPEVRRLVGDGRLAVGPWRILMDEFLVSGETIVRNLEMGLARATDLGRAMAIGYLPDMFGHVAQMPQILRRAGIADAVLWRGVPAAIDRHAFTWSSPDGSSVRCEYLLGGYGNGREVLALADRIGRKLEVFVAQQEASFGTDELLAMYGEDHSVPRPGYADLVAAFNAGQDAFEIRIETLPAALAAIRAASPPALSWQGELRSGARANILMGVTSHRIEVKQAAGRVERLLERAVEPLWALHGGTWPAAYLDEAWSRVVENSAHDSICACSAEATVSQVLGRYAEAEQIATGLMDRLLLDLGRSAPRDGFVVANPSPCERADVVPIELPATVAPFVVDATGRPVAVQEDGTRRTVVREADVHATEVVPYLRRRLHARELFGYQVCGCRFDAEAPAGTEGAATGPRVVTVDVDVVPDPDDLDVDDLLDRVAAQTAGDPDTPWRIVVVARPRRRLLARPVVPGLGTTVLRPSSSPTGDLPELPHPVVARDRELANGLVRAAIAENGSIDITGLSVGLEIEAAGRIVDGGDAGDSYNYAPPRQDGLVTEPVSSDVSLGRPGPLVGEVHGHRVYDWPAGLVPDATARATTTIPTPVETTVEVRADEPFVRISLEIDNRSLDHRVRFHLPLPGGADHSLAEGQFAVVERGLEMEGGHGEVPLPTFPAHGFVAAGRVAILFEHATEYELLPGPGGGRAIELALTLLRATGLISRNENPYREEPAGPVVEAPTGQALGRRRVSFAILPLADEAERSLSLIEAAAERYRHALHAGPGSAATVAGAGAGGARVGIAIDGDCVALASLRRREVADGRVLELRLVHEAGGGTRAAISGPFGAWREVDLLGHAEDGAGEWHPADGTIELAMGGWEIRTVQLRVDGGSSARG
jgi:mannosylglycerate hydrolase